MKWKEIWSNLSFTFHMCNYLTGLSVVNFENDKHIKSGYKIANLFSNINFKNSVDVIKTLQDARYKALDYYFYLRDLKSSSFLNKIRIWYKYKKGEKYV